MDKWEIRETKKENGKRTNKFVKKRGWMRWT